MIPLILIAVAAVLGYLAWCWWWPITFCRSCRGRKGQGRLSSKYGWSRCRRCGGTGERVRITARAISKATGRPVRGSKEN